MHSSRSLRRRKIFKTPQQKHNDFLRKFQQYKPVRFETEACETDRCNYMNMMNKTKRLSPFGRDARRSMIVTRGGGTRESIAEVDENNNTIRGFVHRLRNLDSQRTRTPLAQRANFHKVIKYDKTDNMVSQSTMQSQRIDISAVLQPRNRPIIKQIVKEVLTEIVVESQRHQLSNPQQTFEQQPPVDPHPTFRRLKPKQSSEDQTRGQLLSQNTKRLMTDIRSQIRQMFSMLNQQ